MLPRARRATGHHGFRVTWSPDDGGFVATCVEFPSLSWLADTPESALSELRVMVDGVVADMQRAGEDVPEPLGMEHT